MSSLVEKEKSEFLIPTGVFAEKVTSVHHYTDRLFEFRITRPASLRFRSGEFMMIGLPNSEKPVFRAYSVASPSWDEELEFYSIKVPGGPLTEHLQKIEVGDTVLLRKKLTGTSVNDALLPGKRQWCWKLARMWWAISTVVILLCQMTRSSTSVKAAPSRLRLPIMA